MLIKGSELDLSKKILTLQLDKQISRETKELTFNVKWEDVRPIPEEFGWFETVWKKYSSDDIYR